LTAVGVFCGGMKNKHLSSVKKKVHKWLAAEVLVVTCKSSFKQNQSSLNEFKKCLTAVGIFCGGMKNEHLSSVEKKVNKWLAAKDLAATCITSSK